MYIVYLLHYYNTFVPGLFCAKKRLSRAIPANRDGYFMVSASQIYYSEKNTQQLTDEIVHNIINWFRLINYKYIIPLLVYEDLVFSFFIIIIIRKNLLRMLNYTEKTRTDAQIY